MDENNSFLSSYKKNLEIQNIGGETELKETKSVPVQRYEEKSTFVKPKKKDMGTLPPSGQKPKLIIGAVVLIAAVLGLVLLLNKGIEVIDFTGWTENDSQLWAKENGVMLQIQKEFKRRHRRRKGRFAERKKRAKRKKRRFYRAYCIQRA